MKVPMFNMTLGQLATSKAQIGAVGSIIFGAYLVLEGTVPGSLEYGIGLITLGLQGLGLRDKMQ